MTEKFRLQPSDEEPEQDTEKRKEAERLIQELKADGKWRKFEDELDEVPGKRRYYRQQGKLLEEAQRFIDVTHPEDSAYERKYNYYDLPNEIIDELDRLDKRFVRKYNRNHRTKRSWEWKPASRKSSQSR